MTTFLLQFQLIIKIGPEHSAISYHFLYLQSLRNTFFLNKNVLEMSPFQALHF
jgi:hypothetical protein